MAFLSSNLDEIDTRMGESPLIDWPGKSQDRFADRLAKDLTYRCRDADNYCQNDPGNFGRSVPRVRPNRIQLCMDNIQAFASNFGVALNLTEEAMVAATIGHEIGHLIRTNKDRNSCENQFQRPRFSQSLELAVLHAYSNTAYDPDPYLTTICN